MIGVRGGSPNELSNELSNLDCVNTPWLVVALPATGRVGSEVAERLTAKIGGTITAVGTGTVVRWPPRIISREDTATPAEAEVVVVVVDIVDDAVTKLVQYGNLVSG